MNDRAQVVAVCGSKDCRSRPEYGELHAALSAVSDRCEIVNTRCLDVCSGPVVAVTREQHRPLVLKKLRRRKQRRDLVALVAGGKLTDRLRSVRVTGKPARRAVARIRPRSMSTSTGRPEFHR